ncbi:hypothetical protein HRbin33_01721 [bacterium HR33]|nr:hypothetical protein HRbin33_01721 [bacterium HR33]
MWFLVLAALVQADSAAALERARAAQAEFERVRTAYLPRVYSGSRRRCDEIVGRFCFWHDDEEEEDSWEPPAEPVRIGAARKNLIALLDSVARALPGDDWTAGQLVRYLVEDGRTDQAIRAASRCRGTEWWCSALLGYALHWSRQFAAAESAFEKALDLMPERERCEWEDISLLLDGSYGPYRKADCNERRALERRIWWLADPFLSVPGNERRTEHLARRVMDRMQEGSHSAYGLRWGGDLQELLIRYGWPVAWARDESASRFDALRPAIIAYNPPRGRRFVPPAEVVFGPQPGAGEDWELKPDFPRSTYAVPYAKRLEPVEAQLVAFRRGDSAVVVAAYDLSAGPQKRASNPDAATASRPPHRRSSREIEAALAISGGPDDTPLIVRHVSQGDRGVLAAVYPHRTAIASLEILSGADSTAYRARRWIAAPQPDSGIALSEPLLFGALDADTLPRSLEEVLPAVLGAARVVEGRGVGVYWEMYSASSGEVTVGVTVSREAGFLARLGSVLGIGSAKRDVVKLDWIDRVAASKATPRSLWLALPEAESGDYRLMIEVRSRDGRSASSAKKLRVERP